MAQQGGDPSDNVVVIAAQHALPEYFKYSAYICKRERTFRPCIRLAFYTNNKIDRRVPKIVGQIDAISRGEIETRSDLSDLERERLQGLLESKLERTKGVSHPWNQQFKILLLSSPESPETLILPHDVVNNLTSRSGRRTAFTQWQRYVSLSRLEEGPETTSELI
jgi:hypothetical protein